MTTHRLAKIEAILEPFLNARDIAGIGQWDWYEQHIFNEEHLYKALGKDEARSVLLVWRCFKKVCLLLGEETP